MDYFHQNLNIQFKVNFTANTLKTRQVLRIEWTRGNHPPDSFLQEIKNQKCNILSSTIRDSYGIPDSFSNALAVISTRNKPGLIDSRYWDKILLSIPNLLRGNPSWISILINHGWSMTDIFGCHPTNPQNRIDYMGILLSLQDKEITDVSRDCIVLKTKSNTIQTRRRSNRIYPDQTTLDLLPDEELSNQLDNVPPTPYPNDVSVESYKPLIEERGRFYMMEGYSGEEARWRALNDLVLKFMGDTRFSSDSHEVYGFTQRLLFGNNI